MGKCCAPVERSKSLKEVCPFTGVVPATGVCRHVHNVLVAALAMHAEEKGAKKSALASTNFSAVVPPGRTLYTNGILALPTITIPPGAPVKLSGWDFASTIEFQEPTQLAQGPSIVRRKRQAVVHLNWA